MNVRNVLSSEFVYSDEIAAVIELAAASGRNVLLWGPAGHGKSEMTLAALQALATPGESIFVQSFGEGMDEATLWGGLDLAALEDERIMRFNTDKSFLKARLAIFEEMFDASTSVLLALKDTLTAKQLRKGAQQVAMKTRVIVALTNRDPSEISEMGPAAHALIERFPFQLKVEWPSYTAADYLSMLRKVAPKVSGNLEVGGVLPILADLTAKMAETGDRPVSPRMAVYALEAVCASARLRGVSTVGKEDLLVLRFVSGYEAIAASIQSELTAAAERAAAAEEVRKVVIAVGALGDEFLQAKIAASPIKLLQVAKRARDLGDIAGGLRVTDELVEIRKGLRQTVDQIGAEAAKVALEVTRA